MPGTGVWTSAFCTVQQPETQAGPAQAVAVPGQSLLLVQAITPSAQAAPLELELELDEPPVPSKSNPPRRLVHAPAAPATVTRARREATRAPCARRGEDEDRVLSFMLGAAAGAGSEAGPG
jgi:hypothetical protein